MLETPPREVSFWGSSLPAGDCSTLTPLLDCTALVSRLGRRAALCEGPISSCTTHGNAQPASCPAPVPLHQCHQPCAAQVTYGDQSGRYTSNTQENPQGLEKRCKGSMVGLYKSVPFMFGWAASQQVEMQIRQKLTIQGILLLGRAEFCQ